MATPDFVTFDLETTGLSPKNDRIIEIGLVRTSSSGRLVGEFSTLVNPRRDVGPTDIHGISAGEVLLAPAFEEIVGAIADLTNNGILVAHNAAFDRRFLIAELERASRKYASIDVVCTLQLVRLSYRGGPRRLVDCCSEFGIGVGQAHQAIEDARMTSNLLHHLLGIAELPFTPETAWIDPTPAASASAVQRGSASPRVAEAAYIQKLIHRLPACDDSGVVSAVEVSQYLNFLDRVLEDRRVSSNEADELVSFARDLGFSAAQVATLHASYLSGLCAAAWADDVITVAERSDLRTVATLLGIAEWEELLDSERGKSGGPIARPSLSPGLSVCFTGGKEADKRDLAAEAALKGLIVRTGVSKKLDILVLADADSQSGKAQKARQYGTRLMTVNVFREMLAAMP